MDPLGQATKNPYTLAERLLSVITDALNNNVPHCRPAPERRYVAHGTPVLDCLDQLTVHAGSIYVSSTFGADSGGAIQGPKMFMVDLTVTLTHCHPTGVVQQGTKISAIGTDILLEAAELLYGDGWTAYFAAVNGWKNCGGQTCELHSVTPLSPLDPEGGAAGWQFTLTAEIGQPRKAL